MVSQNIFDFFLNHWVWFLGGILVVGAFFAIFYSEAKREDRENAAAKEKYGKFIGMNFLIKKGSSKIFGMDRKEFAELEGCQIHFPISEDYEAPLYIPIKITDFVWDDFYGGEIIVDFKFADSEFEMEVKYVGEEHMVLENEVLGEFILHPSKLLGAILGDKVKLSPIVQESVSDSLAKFEFKLHKV